MKTDAGRTRPLQALATTVATALLLLAACSESDILTDGGTALPEGMYPVAMTADVVGETRATADGTWKGSEQVAVQDIGSTVTTKLYTVDGNGGLTPSDVANTHWWTNTTETKRLQAWYRGDGSTEVPASWEIKTDQSGDGYQQSDLLFAQPVTVTFGNAAALTFRHQVAKVVVNIMNAEAVTSAEQISTVTIGNGNIIQSGNISLADDAEYVTWTTGTATCTATCTVKPHTATTPATGCVATYEALLIPQTTAGKKMVVVTTADGNSYSYTAPSSDPALEAGKVLTYNITVKVSSIEVDVVTATGGTWKEGESENVTSS